MGESVLGSRSSAPGGGSGGTAVRHGGLYCSLLVTRYPSPVTRHSVTSSLRHFLNGDGGFGPRFSAFGPRWREGAKGKGRKAIGQ